MRNKHPVWSGILLLIIGGVIGYGIGLGIEVLVTGVLNYSGSVPWAFALLFAVTSFFFGLYGYRGITRGLVWQVLGTMIGGFVITGIRAMMGLKTFGDFFFTEPAWVFGGIVG